MFSVMSPSIKVNQKVLIQLHFDKMRKRIRKLSLSCVSSTNNGSLFLSHLSTHQELKEGDAGVKTIVV